MLDKIKKMTLEKQLFFSFLSVSVFLLVLSLGITLSFSIRRRRQEIDKNISSIASYVASMEQIISMIEAGYPDEATIHGLDSLSESSPDINVIVIYNTEGLRFYHTNRSESGETFMAGEEKAILSGSAPYVTVGAGTNGTQRRAFHSIRNKSGEIIGFVMVSVFTDYISEREKELLPAYIFVAMLMLTISIFLSHGIVQTLRASLLGHHPAELLDLYLKQDTVLNAMEEGLIASNKEGTIIFINQSAKKIFAGQGNLVGKQLKEIFPSSIVSTVLRYGGSSYHKTYTLNERRLLISEIPIENQGVVQGVLTVLNDRTEMDEMAEELTGAHTMLDTLRAFNHEFLNKLHVILGYLQTGQTEAAITFIMNSNLVTSQSIRQTADCIRVSPICALVIGKMMHAAELGIVLSVKPDSKCTEHELLIPVDAYITIVGNLLENAIEELSGKTEGLREISLGIYCQGGCNLISCEDTGGGIRPDLLDRIYEKGVSSKGENRGTGLFLIRQLADLYHGEISVDTEPGEGSCFTITFTGKESE